MTKGDIDIDYSKATNQLAKTKSTVIFDNTGEVHASAVMSAIFKNSSETVCIYGQNMNGDISNKGDYYDSLFNFLAKDLSLKVLLDEKPKEGSLAFDLIQACSLMDDAKVSIRYASDKFRDDLAKQYIVKDDQVHFCVGDKRMFRIETDSKNHKAVCSMNNEEHSQKLKSLFDSNFEDCPVIA